MSFENPEHAAARSIDNQTRKSEIDTVVQEMAPYYESVSRRLDSMAIDPADFTDLYGQETVAEDQRYVKRMQQRFTESASTEDTGLGLPTGEVRKLADVLEYQIITGINTHKWIPYCDAIKTSEYDDIKNGVDTVVEFTRGGMTNHFGLGVDVSFSKNLDAKFMRIQDDIDSYDGKENRLGVVKYFQSESTGVRGELSGLPRVVAALDVGVIGDLMRQRRTASDHISRHLVIAEMTEQLGVFSEYAAKRNPACAGKLKRAHDFMSVINESLYCQQTIEDSDYIKNRGIQEEVAKNLERFRL